MILRFPALGKAKNKKVEPFPLWEKPKTKKLSLSRFGKSQKQKNLAFPVLGRAKNKKVSLFPFRESDFRTKQKTRLEMGKYLSQQKSQITSALLLLIIF